MDVHELTPGTQVDHVSLGKGVVQAIVSREIAGTERRFVSVLIERKQLTVQLPLDDPAVLGKLTLVKPATNAPISEPAAEPQTGESHGAAVVEEDPTDEAATVEPETDENPVVEPETDTPEPTFPDGESVRLFIRELDPTLDPASDGFTAACVTWAGMVVGPYDTPIAEFLGLELETVRRFTNRLRGQGIWRGNLIRVDWEGEEGGELSFWLDTGVAEGDFVREEHNDDLAYRMTRRAAYAAERRRREQAHAGLVQLKPWQMASCVGRAGVRLTTSARNEQRQANLARMLLALQAGPLPIAENARRIGVAYETANTLLKELTAAGLARRGSGLRHQGQYVLTNAGRRAAQRLLDQATASTV